MPGRGAIFLYVNPVDPIGIAFQSEFVNEDCVNPLPDTAPAAPCLIPTVLASVSYTHLTLPTIVGV